MFMELLPLFVIGVYAAFAAFEALRPGRAFPKVARWRIKGGLFLLFGLWLTGALPPLWESWMADYRLIDATGLGTWLGAIYGFVVLELFVYAWHRSLHNSKLLWRGFHQMHHSAERVDIWGALYFHPFDLTAFAFVYSFALVIIAGVTPEAALIANLAATFCSFFQHANIKTPAWFGYVIQRPEQHALHHERDVHAYNYSDLPLWDLLFGTWKNPAQWEAKSGFYDGASKRVPEMLVGVDVSVPRTAAAREQVAQERAAA